MTDGATRLPVSRRARRPLSQSFQLIGRPLGMEGVGFSEFMGNFRDSRRQPRQDIIFGEVSEAPNLVPIYLHLAIKGHRDELARASRRRFVRLRVNGDEKAFDQ